MHTEVAWPLDRRKVARLGITSDSSGKIIQKLLGRLRCPLNAEIVKVGLLEAKLGKCRQCAGVARWALSQPLQRWRGYRAYALGRDDRAPRPQVGRKYAVRLPRLVDQGFGLNQDMILYGMKCTTRATEPFTYLVVA